MKIQRKQLLWCTVQRIETQDFNGINKIIFSTILLVHDAKLKEAFELFITNEMIDENTNKNIEPFLEMNRHLIENSNKYTSYKKVDVIDIRTFFGI